MTDTQRTLVVVTGANGAVGRAFLARFQDESNTHCIGISRNTEGINMDGVDDIYIGDLSDERESRSAMDAIDLSTVDQVVFLHGVGQFYFEDPEVESTIEEKGGIVKSNIETFVHAGDVLLQKIVEEHKRGHDVSLTLCALGSISDKEEPELWRTFSQAKNELRAIMQDAARIYSELHVSSMFINISSTQTTAEHTLRPDVSEEERRYWLEPEEIAKRAVPEILALQTSNENWKEVDVFRPSPHFTDGHYETKNALPRWRRAMGRKK